jgi:hypothetical protein
MTVEVPKVIGSVVVGPPSARLIVPKIIGWVLVNPNTPAPTAPQVKKKVEVQARLLYFD